MAAAPAAHSVAAMATYLQSDTDETARDRLLAGVPVSPRRLEPAGVPTFVLEGGAGPPVVLLHGPAGNAAHWARVLPELARTHRVIVPDLPGHGESAAADPARAIAWLDDVIEAHLHGAAGAGRLRARRGDRRPLRRRPRRPAPPARARGRARAHRFHARTRVRARAARLPGPARRGHARRTVAALRLRSRRPAARPGRPLGAVPGLQRRPRPDAGRDRGARRAVRGVRRSGDPARRARAHRRAHDPDLGPPRPGHAAAGRRVGGRTPRLAAARDRGLRRRPAGGAAGGLRAHPRRRARRVHRRARRARPRPLRRAARRLQRARRPAAGADRPLRGRPRRRRGGHLRARRGSPRLRLRRRAQRDGQRGLRRRRHDRPAADEGRRDRPRRAHVPGGGRADLGRARRRDAGARARRDRRAHLQHRDRRLDARRRLGLDRAQVRLRGRQPAVRRDRHRRRRDPDRLGARAPGPVLGHARRRRQLRRGDQLPVSPAPDRPDRPRRACSSTRRPWRPRCCGTSAT